MRELRCSRSQQSGVKAGFALAITIPVLSPGMKMILRPESSGISGVWALREFWGTSVNGIPLSKKTVIEIANLFPIFDGVY